MSFEVFVALCLVGCWAMFPISLMIATKTFDDDIIGGGHHDHDHDEKH
ncbi:hypothetical protein [Halobacteriovorax sp. JY17]|nr:hypothetical protein [Halobacteriovorax sp. JY17]